MAERRKVHEIWISAELEGDDGVADIVEIAAARRVPLRHVAKGKLEHEARTDAPQGCWRSPPRSRRPTSVTLMRGEWRRPNRSWSPSTG